MKLQWMRLPGKSRIALFRTEVDFPESGILEFEYTADEKCQWFADGHFIGSGNEKRMRS